MDLEEKDTSSDATCVPTIAPPARSAWTLIMGLLFGRYCQTRVRRSEKPKLEGDALRVITKKGRLGSSGGQGPRGRVEPTKR